MRHREFSSASCFVIVNALLVVMAASSSEEERDTTPTPEVVNVHAIYDRAIGRSGLIEAASYQVMFALDSASLDAAAIRTIEEAVQELSRGAGYVVHIYGFADPRGSNAYNFTLARRRANAVEQFLADRLSGASTKIRSISFGETIPAFALAQVGAGRSSRQVLISVLVAAPPTANASLVTEPLEEHRQPESPGLIARLGATG